MQDSSLASSSPRQPRHSWVAVGAAALATFSVVTTEMLPVGLLTPVAATLGSSTGTAGLMISLPAMLAALCAPLVLLAAGRTDRRKLLCALQCLLILANVAAALAQDMAAMLAARIVVGVCMGGIWAIAGTLAARLVPAEKIGLATSLIFGGVAAASVLGVPLGAMAGEAFGWRWAFGAMAIFSTLVLLLELAVLPGLPVNGAASTAQFAGQLRLPQVQGVLVLTLLLVGGHFMAFTFVRPLLSAAGFDDRWLGILLFAYGVAGMAGNFLSGLLAARNLAANLMAIALGLILAPLLLHAAGQWQGGAFAVLLLWGLAYGGLSLGLMNAIMRCAPGAGEIAGSLYVSVFNIGIALGAYAGGHLVDRLGLQANLGVAASLAGIGLLLVARLARRINRTGIEN